MSNRKTSKNTRGLLAGHMVNGKKTIMTQRFDYETIGEAVLNCETYNCNQT